MVFDEGFDDNDCNWLDLGKLFGKVVAEDIKIRFIDDAERSMNLWHVGRLGADKFFYHNVCVGLDIRFASEIYLKLGIRLFCIKHSLHCLEDIDLGHNHLGKLEHNCHKYCFMRLIHNITLENIELA